MYNRKGTWRDVKECQRAHESSKGYCALWKRLDRSLYHVVQRTHMCVVHFDISNWCFQSTTSNAFPCKHLSLAWVLVIETLKHSCVYGKCMGPHIGDGVL